MNRGKLKEALQDLGIPVNENTLEQFEVFVEALQTYESRSHSYGEVWRQYGAVSSLLSVARKTDRMMESWHHLEDGIHKESMDDAIDLLNYCTFFIRNFRDGNLTGTRPDRYRQIMERE